MMGSEDRYKGSSDSNESACNAGDPGSIPESGRSSGKGNGYPLQYSCLENAMDRGALWAMWGGKESDTTKKLTLSLSKRIYIDQTSLLWRLISDTTF